VRQLDADLRRFFARRIVRGTILLALLIAVIAVTIPTVRGHTARTDTPTAQIQVGTAPDGSRVYEYVTPPGNTGDTRIDVGKSLTATLEGISVLMIFVGAVLGASFVGAEFHQGSLTSQLLYEPRRWRVHFAKASAVALGCAVFAAGLCLVVTGLMYAGSEVHGIVRGIDAVWWRHRSVQVGRATATGASAAIMAYAVALVTRRTSAAIVAFFVQYPFILIVHPHTPIFGVVSHYAPMRGLLTVAIDPRHNGGPDSNVDLIIHTSAGAITFTVVWMVALGMASGMIFSRSEVR
jgi:hypothetical protein